MGGQGSSGGKGAWPPRLTLELNLWNSQGERKNQLPCAGLWLHIGAMHVPHPPQYKKYLQRNIENSVNALFIVLSSI